MTSRAREYELGLFPLEMVFNAAAFSEWKMGYQEHHSYERAKMQFLNRFEQEIWLRLQRYKVPVIELLKETPKEAVCQVFEKVNTGGVALTVFELVTATFAAEDFALREAWDGLTKRLKKKAVLHDVDGAGFLTAVTLCATYRRNKEGKGAVGCRRKDILKLDLSDYRELAPLVEGGFMRAARFLNRENVFDTRGLPYQSQLVPLAVICAELGDQFEHDHVRQKLARWYWAGVFGELYGGANEGRFAFDVPEVLTWILADGGEPRTIKESNFAPARLLTLQTRGSAAYKGLMARLIEAGSHDFLSGDPIVITTYYERNIDIHHIFPRAYCEGAKLDRRRWNSIINKAPISASSNRAIGGHRPSKYIASIQSAHKVEPARLDDILKTHLIDPLLLRNDAFDSFIRDRALKQLDLIERATGKQVTGRDSDETVAAFGAPLTADAGATTA